MHVFVTAPWPVVSEDERGSRIIIIIVIFSWLLQENSTSLEAHTYIYNLCWSFLARCLVLWTSCCGGFWVAVQGAVIYGLQLVYGAALSSRACIVPFWNVSICELLIGAFGCFMGSLAGWAVAVNALQLWPGGLGLTGRRDGAFLSILLWLVLRYISSFFLLLLLLDSIGLSLSLFPFQVL